MQRSNKTNIFKDKSIFKNHLKAAMMSNGINSRGLARRTGLSEASISRYLSGEMTPKFSSITKIAEALHVDPMWLFNEEKPEDNKCSYKYCPYCGMKLDKE